MDVLRRIYKNRYPDLPENDKQAKSYLKSRGIEESSIKAEIEKALNTTYFDVDKEINGDLVKKFSKDEMKARRIFPVGIENGKVLFVVNALSDRSLRAYADEYTRKLGYKEYDLGQFLISSVFDELLESVYLGLNIEKFRSLQPRTSSVVIDVNKELATNGFDAESVAEIILSKGFENRASDIHIEPLHKGFQVRYRVDGMLSIIDPYDVTSMQTSSLINHFKIKGGMKIEERRQGQDGRIKDRKYKGNSYDLRLSTISGSFGEKIAIRTLENNTSIPEMRDLGFGKFYTKAILKDMEKHQGLILNTGSVGSGKSTTQQTLLYGLDAKKLNIYSIEDPVERTIPYVSHICVKETGVSFEKHLETLLRQDPDVIAIGEVRNLETMDMALKAALTGNLVFATMHTNSAVEAIYRLYNMGVEPYELSAALVGVGSQRLVRTLCSYCSEKREIQDTEKHLITSMLNRYTNFNDFNLDKFQYLHDAVGCSHCNYTGYRGRFVVAEYLSLTSEIRNYIATGKVERDKMLSMADDSFVPIEVDALNKVLLGKTTLAEIIKSV